MYYDEPPPQPRFNKRDDTECVLAIEQLYQDAVLAYDEKLYKEDSLYESYRTILAKKAAYGFSFINNNEFLEWSMADFDQTWEAQNNPDAQPPELSWSMKEVFIAPPNSNNQKNLDTEEDIDSAMYALFWYRQSAGLENYATDNYEPAAGWDSYEMCTQNTQELGGIYEQIMSNVHTDFRFANYYPLLDRLIEWMDTTYGNIRPIG